MGAVQENGHAMGTPVKRTGKDATGKQQTRKSPIRWTIGLIVR